MGPAVRDTFGIPGEVDGYVEDTLLSAKYRGRLSGSNLWVRVRVRKQLVRYFVVLQFELTNALTVFQPTKWC